MAKAAVPSAELARVLKRLHRPVFQVPPKEQEESALERLLALVLQMEGSYRVARRAVRALGRYYAHWNEVRLARRYEIQEVLAQARISHPAERAALAQEFLRRVFGLQNHLELDWLYDATSERRGRLLSSLGDPAPHAGPVLDLDAALMDPDLEVPPVSTGSKRLLARLGIAPPNPKDVRVREILAPALEGTGLYPGYVSLQLHARVVCESKHPRCRHCPILDVCAFGRRSLSPASFQAALQEMGLGRQGGGKSRKSGGGSARKKTVKKATGKNTSGGRSSARKGGATGGRGRSG